MSWYPFVGYGVFWIGLMIAIVLYAMKRKWYPLFYLISASLYIFTVLFVIDEFNLSKNSTLGVLAFSALVMIFMGFHLSKKKSKK